MRAGTTADGGGAASFEVDRLEWVAPDRLEVAGRWFGVRGLRFVRPTLDLEAGDERRHLLAVLDHKPWEARDGDEWVAAFPWDGEEVELSRAELAVTPAVIVELPVDGRSGTARQARPAEKPKRPAPARRVERDAPEERARAEAQALRQERDAALAARDEATAERDAARAGRDAAQRERDELAQARDAAEAARADALTRLEAASRERDAAREERDRATQSLKVALEREKRASAARDHALRERDEALRERDDAQRARDELSRKHTATLAATELSAAPSLGPAAEPSPWRVRAIALGALALLLAIAAAVVQGVL